jgi:chromosome partitioning protein
MSKVIAIAQHKGGVGKTTTTVNLGAALEVKGYKVLLIDLDAQANLTDSLGISTDKTTIERTLKSDIPFFEEETVHVYGNLYAIPSTLELAGVEVLLLNSYARELILKNLIDQLRKHYDYILIDCPPSLGLLTVNALSAADQVIIPLQAQYLAVKGLKSLLDIIAMIKKQLNRKLTIGGVLVTQYDSRKVLNRDIAETIRADFKAEVFDTKIRDNVAIAEAPTAKQDIFRYAPTSNGAQDYKALAEEIIKRNTK